MTTTDARHRDIPDYDRPRGDTEDVTDATGCFDGQVGLLTRYPVRHPVADDVDGDLEDLAIVDMVGRSAAPWLTDFEPNTPVLPVQGDEFTCTRCFLISHRSQLTVVGAQTLCQECA